MSKKLLLVVNPKSGKAKMKSELLNVVTIFSNNDYEVTVYPTKKRRDATKKIASLKENSYDLIVVCGGDGTLNEAITGLMDSELKCDIGYIPAGTLNEWSQGLGISRIIKNAAGDITNGQVKPLDIGKFGDKYFSYTASFGAFTAASYSAPQNVKNVLGQTAYFFGGLKELANIRPIELKITADEKVIEGKFIFGAISNSMSVGGIVKFNESVVNLSDGLLEVVLIRYPENILKLQPLLDGILKKDFSKDGIEFLHAKKIVVECEGKLDWTLDGEHARSRNQVIIENIHNAINFVLPKK